MTQESEIKISPLISISNDRDVVQVPMTSLRLSPQISEELKLTNATTIRVTKTIDYETLQFIAEYLNHYAENDPFQIPNRPLTSKYLLEITKSEWDTQFLLQLVQCGQVIKVTNAASEMNIHSLVNLCALFLSLQIKGIPSTDIKSAFLKLESVKSKDEVKGF